MTRINLNKYDQVKEKSVGGGCLTGSIRDNMNDSNELCDVIKLISQNALIIWVSNGKWSTHELLTSLLNITGPASVHISSYALSEKPTRQLILLKDAGLITELYCVIDNRVDTRTAVTLQIIKSICDDYALIDTHAKVTVITNGNWSIAVIGSANYTENKRYESGVIICTPAAAAFSIKWIEKALKDGVK